MAAQAQCLALASDTLDPIHLCSCERRQWESIGEAFICDLFHKGYTRVTHQLRVEPITTQAALQEIRVPVLN